MQEYKVLKKDDKYFPKGFLELGDCPEKLFYMGDETILNEFSIALIGARKCTFEGKEVAKEIAKTLSNAGINIVSGLALGIDSVAHEACVLNGAKTIAVLGGGLANIYPKQNISLVKRIIESGGVIISEYHPETPYLPTYLHKRNRLIAALSKGIIIVEARKKSGTLITAQYAEKLNKDIMVVPGNVNDLNYEGSNELIVNGKTCVRNGNDVLRKYGMLICGKEKAKKSEDVIYNIEESRILKAISKRGTTIDELCITSGFDVKKLYSKLTLFEIKGLVKKDGNKFYKI